MTLRCGLWAAVSTPKQAEEDKVSIKIQLEKGREFIASRQLIAAGEFVVPGQSRTRYISLYHAEKEIPVLRAMLESASRREFDLLFVYDLNRFRTLMRQVFDVLCDYNIQLYIGSYPRDPVPAAEYTEEVKSAVGMIVDLANIISRSETTSLQKHYREKMPARVMLKKLHPGLGLPLYGYHKPAHAAKDPDAVLEILPAEARILYQMKDWFLSGLSLTEIAKRLNESGTPSPRGKQWWYSIVSYILSNPFYAGTVTFGSTKRQRDRRTGMVKRVKGLPVSTVGLHKPLWDRATHQRILDEMIRRRQGFSGIKTRQLSRLLKCECGATLWAQSTPAGRYWRCSSGEKGHTYLNDKLAMQLIVPEIIDAIRGIDTLKLPQPKDKRPALLAEIKDLKTRQKRWLDAYESGSLDLSSIAERLDKIKNRLAFSEELLAKNEAETTRSLNTRATLTSLAASIDALPEYYLHGPPTQVNADLRSILDTITITRDHKITLHWR